MVILSVLFGEPTGGKSPSWKGYVFSLCILLSFLEKLCNFPLVERSCTVWITVTRLEKRSFLNWMTDVRCNSLNRCESVVPHGYRPLLTNWNLFSCWQSVSVMPPTEDVCRKCIWKFMVWFYLNFYYTIFNQLSIQYFGRTLPFQNIDSRYTHFEEKIFCIVFEWSKES